VTVSWVIGASGLLGRQVLTSARSRGHALLHPPIPWEDHVLADAALEAGVGQFHDEAGDDRWNLIWVAGAGVVGTSEVTLAEEHNRFARLLATVGERLPSGPGAVFLASSAGGVYAGSSGPPFTERSEPRALAPYGANKLRMEATLRAFVEQHPVSAVIGRIANLYGPGQNLAKPQGLISQLARAHLLRQPLSLYVSPDTTRDYLYVKDCAEMVIEMLPSAAAGADLPGRTITKILAAETPTTIAALLAEFRRLVKRRLPIVLADSPNRRFQVRDLRLKSVVPPDLHGYARTTLATGIDATISDLAGQLRLGTLQR